MAVSMALQNKNHPSTSLDFTADSSRCSWMLSNLLYDRVAISVRWMLKHFPTTYRSDSDYLTTRGTCTPTFLGGGNIICRVPPLFLFRFCIWRNSKNKSGVCHVLRDVLFMLDVTHSQVDVETEFGVVSLDSVSLSIVASIKWYSAFFKFL